jgi:hypothetical protein
MEFQEFRKFAHDVKNHLTGATLQLQVLKMICTEEHHNRLNVIEQEITTAGDMMTEFQQRIKEAQAAADAEQS